MRSRSYNRDVDMENLYESDSGNIFYILYIYLMVFVFFIHGI